MNSHVPRLAVGLGVVLVLVGALVFSPPAIAEDPPCLVENAGTEYPSLSSAIEDADPGNRLEISGRCDGPFTISMDLTLEGDGEAILDGDGSSTVLTISDDADVELIALAIRNGAAEYGGGIRMGYDVGISLTLRDSTVSGNAATNSGGGIYNPGYGSIWLINSTVADNTASVHGGGIYNYGGAVEMTGSHVTGNTVPGTGSVGGIYNGIGEVTLTNSSVSGNAGYHGGLHNVLGTLTLDNVKVRDNEGVAAGGIFSNDGQVEIAHSKVERNSADTKGGGIYVTYAQVTLTGSTVSRNAAGQGGGIYSYEGEVALENSTVSRNTGGGINYNGYEGSFSITDSVVGENNGTGIWNGGGSLTLDNTTVAENTGGGISNNYGVVTVTDALVRANEGGGIYTKGTFTLTDSEVTGNTTTGRGGGIGLTMGTLTLNDSTVTGNFAPTPGPSGGGIWKTPSPASMLYLNGTSSVIGNTPDDILESW